MEEQATVTAPAEGVSVHDRLMERLSGDEPQPEKKEEEQEEAPEAAEPEAPENDGPKEDSEPLLTTADLAQYLGVDETLLDVDDDGTPVITAKVDGVETKAKLKDLVESYQLRSHYDKRIFEVAEQQKQLAEARARVDQEALQKFQAADDIYQIGQDQLLAEYKSVDWQTLRATDPGEYAALQADFTRRQGAIAQQRQAIEAARNQQVQKLAETQAAAEVEQLKAEAAKVSKNIPEWADEATAKKEKAELAAWGREYLAKWGESPDLLNKVNKGVIVDLLRSRMLYERLLSGKEKMVEKIRKAPKLIKSGSPATQQEKQSSTTTGLRKSIQKSGGKQGIKEYLIATGRV